MAIRIAGVTLPQNKRIIIALQYVYGIGATRADAILSEAGIDKSIRSQDLSEQDIAKLREAIEKGGMNIEGDLRREVTANIRRLKEIGAYRGSRHAHGLPVRGQRTKTNSRTIRGNVRKTVGSGRRAAAQKT